MENTNENFITLEEIIQSYSNVSYEVKLNYLKKLCKDIAFNEDYQLSIINNNFLGKVVDDIYFLLFIEKEAKEKYQTYVRIFFMFFHNELNVDSNIQKKLFNDLFKNKITFDKLKSIILEYKTDLKVQKFLLGSFYKLFFLNIFILVNELNI